MFLLFSSKGWAKSLWIGPTCCRSSAGSFRWLNVQWLEKQDKIQLFATNYTYKAGNCFKVKALLVQRYVRYKAMHSGSTRLQQAQYIEMEEGAVMLTPGQGLFPTPCIVLPLTQNTQNTIHIVVWETLKINISNRYNFDHFNIFVLLLKTLHLTPCCLVRFLDIIYQNIQYLSNISFSVKMSKCPKGESRRYKSASL